MKKMSMLLIGCVFATGCVQITIQPTQPATTVGCVPEELSYGESETTSDKPYSKYFEY